MSFDLTGHRAIVTGAARGIGLGIVHRLHELGVSVSGWDIDPAPIASDAAFAHSAQVDVTSEASIAGAFDNALSALGHVDILINNAGINGPTKPFWDYSLEDWNAVLAVDLTGVFIGCRAVLPHMRQRGYGRIVTVASVAAKEGNPGAAAYGAAKAGVLGFTKGIAREVIGFGITVNCIAPVMTETDLLAGMDEAYIADRRARIPMGRFCSVPEIADMVAWAASPRCSFTTGQCFDVTGGRATY